jgi:hypothetical protein
MKTPGKYLGHSVGKTQGTVKYAYLMSWLFLLFAVFYSVDEVLEDYSDGGVCK